MPGKAPGEEEPRAVVLQDEVMKGAYAPGAVLLLLDARPLVRQNEPGDCWGDPKDPPVMQTNRGRKRRNLLGGYHPAEYALIHRTGAETCDAKRGLAWFERIARPPTAAPDMVLFAEHARDFKATMATEWREAHPQAPLEFRPPEAPN